MSISAGKQEYDVSNGKVIAIGVSHTFDEMCVALQNEVYDKLYDIQEQKDILDQLADTGFSKAVLIDSLFPIVERKDWEIGEAYAQAYIEERMCACIPWGISRDLKKPGSSLPGADIVGICRYDNDTYFLFGEIKTSSQKKYPPNVIYGETGLKKQLEDLCENDDIIHALVLYLAHRLKNSDKWSDYRKAFMHYMNSKGKSVAIVGALVRDVIPCRDDLQARAEKLKQYVSNGRKVELIGIYLPVDSISGFCQIIHEECERRSISNDK